MYLRLPEDLEGINPGKGHGTSTSIPNSFFIEIHSSLCTDIGDYLDPGAGPCTWPCWASWDLHSLISQICLGLEMDGIPSLQLVCTTHLDVVYKLADAVINPIIYITYEDMKYYFNPTICISWEYIKYNLPHYRLLRNISHQCFLLDIGLLQLFGYYLL